MVEAFAIAVADPKIPGDQSSAEVKRDLAPQAMHEPPNMIGMVAHPEFLLDEQGRCASSPTGWYGSRGLTDLSGGA
jgi:hypothetical protein